MIMMMTAYPIVRCVHYDPCKLDVLGYYNPKRACRWDMKTIENVKPPYKEFPPKSECVIFTHHDTQSCTLGVSRLEDSQRAY